MNPWLAIWFQTRKTIRWIADNKPLYGVIAILITLYALDIIKANIGGASTESAVSGGLRDIGLTVLNAVFFPLLTVALLYGVSKLFKSRATIANVVSVLAWSLVPVIVLSAITIPIALSGVSYAPPVLTNEISFECGILTLEPSTPQINTAAFLYFIFSSIFYLWSFQILLSGFSEVMGFGMRRTLWILTLAMVAMMVIDIPISLLFGQFSLFDMTGLSDLVEQPTATNVADCP